MRKLIGIVLVLVLLVFITPFITGYWIKHKLENDASALFIESLGLPKTTKVEAKVSNYVLGWLHSNADIKVKIDPLSIVAFYIPWAQDLAQKQHSVFYTFENVTIYHGPILFLNDIGQGTKFGSTYLYFKKNLKKATDKGKPLMTSLMLRRALGSEYHWQYVIDAIEDIESLDHIKWAGFNASLDIDNDAVKLASSFLPFIVELKSISANSKFVIQGFDLLSDFNRKTFHYNLSFQSKPIIAVNDKMKINVAISDGDISANYEAAKQFTYRWIFPSVKVDMPTSPYSFMMDKIDMGSNVTKEGKFGLWLGSGYLKMPNLTIVSPESFKLQNLVLNQQNTLTGDTLNFMLTSSADVIEYHDQHENFGPMAFKISLTLKNISAAGAAKMIGYNYDLITSPSLTALMLNAARVEEISKDFYSLGVVITSDFTLTFKEGNIVGSLQAKLPKDIYKQEQGAAVPKDFEFTSKIVVSSALVKSNATLLNDMMINMPMPAATPTSPSTTATTTNTTMTAEQTVDAKMNALIKEGYIVLENDHYVFNIAIQKSIMSINGKELGNVNQ